MANIQYLLSQLQGAQSVNPAAALLNSRANTRTTASVQPADLPNIVQAQAQTQDMSKDFYDMLNKINDRINTNRAEAEDVIAANAQKAHEEALMRRIQAMIPQPISYGGGGGGGYTSGGGGGYSNPSGSINSNPGGGHYSGGGSILPDIGGHPLTGGVHLPNVYPPGQHYGGGSPVTAPPRGGCTPHMIELGLCG